MSLGISDLQLSQVPGVRKSRPLIVAEDEAGDLENVRLLDSYESGDNSHTIVIDGEGEGEREEGMKRIQVRVTGMTCAACSNSVESALKSVNGILRASVALLQNKADVVFDPALVKVGGSWLFLYQIFNSLFLLFGLDSCALGAELVIIFGSMRCFQYSEIYKKKFIFPRRWNSLLFFILNILFIWLSYFISCDLGNGLVCSVERFYLFLCSDGD